MESKGRSRALPRNRSRQTLAPSDPEFDRTTLLDHEYIELLLFENKELASVVVQKDKTIAALEERVKGLSIDKGDFKNSDSSNSLKLTSAGESSEPPVITAEIPHRSARRRRNSNQNGTSQAPPDILSTTTTPQEVSPTNPRNKEIANILDTGGALPKISIDPSISLEDSSISSPTVTPIGKKLVNPLTEKLVNANEKTVNSSVKSAGFTANSAISANSINSANSASANSTAANSASANSTAANSTTSNSTTSRDKLSDTAIPNYPKAEKTEDNDNSTLNESILTIDSDPNISVNDSFGNKNSPSDPIYQESSNENKSVYSDNKYNQSSSSFSSYKSRIKLPPTLHLQKQQLQNLVKKQSSTSQLPNHLNEPTSPKMSREGDANSLYQTNLKSPALFNHSSHDNLRSGRDTPQISQLSNFESTRLVPRTPEAFSTSKFPTKFQDNLHPSDDTHSYISSPIQGSFRNPQMSPDRSNYKGSYDSEALRSPINSGYMSTDSMGTPRPSAQTPGSSFHVLSTPKLEEDDTCLLIKPEEFNTINVTVVSTINTAQNKRSDDPNCTFSISDRDSEKEMWKIRKTYSQLVAFDNEIRPIVEYFGLPALPERILFNSSSPGKIELRRISLQNYFNTLFVMPHIPQMVLYRICRYLSLDFVNPLDDYMSGARKEGFLIRRYKGLGTSWKVRWCQVDGPFLEVYEVPGGAILEQIKLRGSLIGRQSNDSVAEDKGYRHALLIMEPQKPKLTSSYAKHFFCAETDEERDDWVEALLEFNDSFSGGTTYDVDQQSIPPETPLPKYEYQEELDHSNRLQTPSLNYTVGSHSHSNDQVSSITVISDDSVKEQKKAKKRSYFPFRTKINGVNLGSLLSSENVVDVDPSNVPVPHTPQDGSMQHYLDQLNLDEDLTKRIFGREIEDAFELSNGDFLGRQIPSICLRCLDFLIKTGAVYEEGIFRLSGSASAIRQLKERFNTQFDLDLFECDLKPDMHTVAGLFKTYLRELPNPIMGGSAYNHLNSIILQHGLQIVPSQLAVIFRDYFANPANISQVHYDMCYVLFKFLNQVIANHKTNRMNLRNVCIVFVPTLNISIEVLTTFLVDFDCIFENGAPVADDKREVLDLHIPNF